MFGLDFYKIQTKVVKGRTLVYPAFQIVRSSDIMTRGGAFYAIWNQNEECWTTDEYKVARIIDSDILKTTQELQDSGIDAVPQLLRNYENKHWISYRMCIKHMPDNYKTLDSSLVFANTPKNKKLYSSKSLDYSLESGEITAYDKMISTLYVPAERQKIEWSIGAIVSGDSSRIQKFLVLYGRAGTGKSTILDIVCNLFKGYYTTFDAKALGSNNNQFATEIFKSNPLVAIQHDGDLSRIEDNSKLNSIVSHEEMVMNEKFKATYSHTSSAFLLMATNKPVKITDAKSGLIRRLIDVRPSGNLVPVEDYHALQSQIGFELGAIAYHCLSVYKQLGKNYYNDYIPLDMMMKTDVFYNFVESAYNEFAEAKYIYLNYAYEMYKTYCDISQIDLKLPKYKFREELKNYFHMFHERIMIDNTRQRSVYEGFNVALFEQGQLQVVGSVPEWLNMQSQHSYIDEYMKNRPAQYTTTTGAPLQKWEVVVESLADISTRRQHFVRPEPHHIVIDFDLKDENGQKDISRSLAAALQFPETYAELSRSGDGLHLHYIYDGDVSELAAEVSQNIEIKTFLGKSALRRKLSLCNAVPIATIRGGLPKKEEKKVISFERAHNEKTIRHLIERNLRKEIHPNTKPSIDFIKKILDDAKNDPDLVYDVMNMKPQIIAFALTSSNQAKACLDIVDQMQFRSQDPVVLPDIDPELDEMVFFDTECFPNLFLIKWKYRGDHPLVEMINPTPDEVALLMKTKLVGFNCKAYDNHMIYACYLGYTNEQLYNLSQRLIGDKNQSATFREAFNISYLDVYKMCVKRQSLKKWQIELGIFHKECDHPWHLPVPPEKIKDISEYCGNDVVSLEAVFDSNQGDFAALQILAELSGLSLNTSINNHTAQIVFGDEKNPQQYFPDIDLSETFPGYTFENGKSMYRGIDPKEGGLVLAEPGIWYLLLVLDVMSMHPFSALAMNAFGKFTPNFEEIVQTRIAIKHNDLDKARAMFGGRVAKYMDDPKLVKALANALKIAINAVYGQTAGTYANRFKDPRNKDNKVAKRGALFMIDLYYKVKERGYIPVHIKTDSIKIPNPSSDLIEFICTFGKRYGYTFEVEDMYARFCLVNNAVYIAYDDRKEEWHAKGAQFAKPYVFKTLFSNEPILFEDMCEAKSVTGTIYMDYNETLPDSKMYDKERARRRKLSLGMTLDDKDKTLYSDLPDADFKDLSKTFHNYEFVGRNGLFTPVIAGVGGAELIRENEGTYGNVGGTKGYRWLPSDMVRELGMQDKIDKGYYEALRLDAFRSISEYNCPHEFINPGSIERGLTPEMRTDCESCKLYTTEKCPDLPF